MNNPARAAYRRAPALTGLLMAVATATPATTSSPAQLTPQEERGRIVYLQGTSPSGSEITALMGDAGTEVPAAIIPCAGCHGRDGRGRPEGGVAPSNLTWQSLTRPYIVDRPGGRRHPPYDRRLLKRAITLGSDPAGNRLNRAMPRYRLSLQDIEDLVSYIEKLGSESDPGLSSDAITFATVESPRGSLGAAVEAVLRATFDRLNRGGGIYGRRIELRTLTIPDAGADREALRKALTKDEVFGLIATALPGAEADLAALAAELEMPVIGPLTQQPLVENPPNPFVFYLLPGLADLSRALARHAVHESDGDDLERAMQATIVVSPGPGSAGLDRATQDLRNATLAISEQTRPLGWQPARILEWSSIAADVPAQLRSSAGPIFLFMAGDQQAAFFRTAAAVGWTPRVYIPGSFLTGRTFQAPTEFSGRISVAFPMHPAGQNLASTHEYRSLVDEYHLPTGHRTAQLATLAATKVLVEGLRRAGRDLSRYSLIGALEALNEFDNGLTPLVTYGPNRRIGILGAYVATIDLERHTLVPGFGWVDAR